jgi:serine O-acetyltransferase
MDSFIDELYEKHKVRTVLPSQLLVNTFIDSLLSILFPTYNNKLFAGIEKLEEEYDKNKNQLNILLLHVKNDLKVDSIAIRNSFYNLLPEIYKLLILDAEAIESGDPAATNRDEVMRSYPGFYAISVYRIAHILHTLEVPFIPRILTEIAHSKTGIDIHPAAEIGNSFFIDHGTGIVIGATTIIGSNVKIYQGVTLGALSVKKHMAELKRHPTIEDNVVIYSGATILGGTTVIGRNSTIGGNVWITKSVKPNSLVYHKADLKIEEINK